VTARAGGGVGVGGSIDTTAPCGQWGGPGGALGTITGARRAELVRATRPGDGGAAVQMRNAGVPLAGTPACARRPACPFPWDATTRVASAHRRAARLDPSSWSPEHRHLTVEQALDLVGRTPPADRLVVCHGDACVPNTLVGDDGSWCGHVDLGALGVGDRWADLAVATWSTAWNYGPGWEDALIGAYGVEPDPVRTAYYRLLWELGP